MTPPRGRADAARARAEQRAQARLDKARRQHRARQAREQSARSRREARRTQIREMPPHARRRRRLLRWSWLPAGLLLGLALNLLLLGPRYTEARGLYDVGDEWEAIDAFDRQERWAVVERWKASFNAGTARYRAGLYSGAVRYLDEALETVPDEHRCDVQTNRALALLGQEEEDRTRAEEQLAFTEALVEALEAQAAGEPFDPEVLEPPYEGADPPELADELWLASFYLRDAADSAALAAEALADPACTPPPSQGGGGEDDDEDEAPQDPADPQDQDGGGGEDEAGSPQQQAEQRMLDLLDLAGDVERLAQAAEDGTLTELPAPDAGDQEPPDPAQAEAERQQQLAERNEQANGGGAGQEAPGGGEGTGTAPGGGTEPGTGGGGGGRNW